MTRNEQWHDANTLPTNPTMDQQVKWHLSHARHCSCRPVPGAILEEFRRRYMGTHQEFWIFFNREDHMALATWAAVCAAHVLPLFEGGYASDDRPRAALKALQTWIDSGVFSMPVIRGASLAAHAAAREVADGDIAARFAARACGHAVATAHVPTHAFGPAMYGLKAVSAANPAAENAAAQERAWQLRQAPEYLRWWIVKWLAMKERQ